MTNFVEIIKDLIKRVSDLERKPTLMKWVVNTDGTNITFDMSKGTRHSITVSVTGRTFLVSNAVEGMVFVVRVKQPAGGSCAVNWFAGITWAGGSIPTLTATGNKADEFIFICTGTNTYDGFVVGLNI